MDIQYHDQSAMPGGQAVTFQLAKDETAHVLHPKQIIAFRGASSQRVDKLMNIKGMYRKRRWIRADLKGPCMFVAALPPSVTMKAIHLKGDNDLLYDFKHLFFYTDGITMATRILSMKNMMITRDALRMKFSGDGYIGILTQGQVLELPLDPHEPVYVEAGSVIAYPENAQLELSVYGNHLASQHMRYQWKITGTGCALIQTGSGNHDLERGLQNDDGLIKRFLREVIPFGGIFIK